MVMDGHLEQTDLQEYVKVVLGSGYEVKRVSRLHGGAQKVVYKINCTNGFTCMLYVWDLSQNYFEADILHEHEGLHAQLYGSEPFKRSYEEMRRLGIRTPILYGLNQERTKYSYDYALVEYVDGYPTEAYMKHPDTRVQDKVFQRLGEVLYRMHGQDRKAFGLPGIDGESENECHLLLVDNAKVQLSYVIEHHEMIRKVHNKLLELLMEMAANIQLRRRYGWIHGELGPDHVLVNKALEPILIDIEGAQYFDIEHEHSFLQLRFGEHYRYLTTDRLDPVRMQFYWFHHHISLTSGGLKLLHRGFPDRSFAQQLTAYHANRLLQFV